MNWIIGAPYRKAAYFPQGTKLLIGADVMEAEALLPLSRKDFQVAAYRLQQREGAAHIAADERPRAIDQSKLAIAWQALLRTSEGHQ